MKAKHSCGTGQEVDLCRMGAGGMDQTSVEDDWCMAATFVAFVCLISVVNFQMFPQIACLRRGKVALVAFA